MTPVQTLLSSDSILTHWQRMSVAGWLTVFSPFENQEIGLLCLLGSKTRDYSRFEVPAPEVGGEATLGPY